MLTSFGLFVKSFSDYNMQTFSSFSEDYHPIPLRTPPQPDPVNLKFAASLTLFKIGVKFGSICIKKFEANTFSRTIVLK